VSFGIPIAGALRNADVSDLGNLTWGLKADISDPTAQVLVITSFSDGNYGSGERKVGCEYYNNQIFHLWFVYTDRDITLSRTGDALPQINPSIELKTGWNILSVEEDFMSGDDGPDLSVSSPMLADLNGFAWSFWINEPE